MTPKRIQFFIALVFFVLGGWGALFPAHVIDTTLLPEYREGGRILPFVVACFDAQALLSGLSPAFSRFSSLTFLVYGIALVPFLGFNYYFTFHDPVFTNIGLLDAVGNVIMLALCYVGWKKSKAAEQGMNL